jgi:hypothetical protein
VQFTAGHHALDDVGTANQFAIDIQLRNGWPITKFLDALTDRFISQHVNRLVVVQQPAQRSDRGRRKAAARRITRALHEKNHAMLGQQ